MHTVVIFQTVAVVYINVVMCLLSIQTQGCITLALQHYLDANFMNTQIAGD